ncbi:MAG: BrnA antitoxin family protein [Betaproteobacteria bacterium]
MSASKKSTAWVDPDDAPELTEADMSRATFHLGGAEVSRDAFREDIRKRPPGRPPLEVKRPMMSMRVDVEVLAHLRSTGRGWQTRVNALLREAMKSGKL